MWGTRLRMCNGRLWWWHRNTLTPSMAMATVMFKQRRFMSIQHL
jgi:hypothetical protein